MARVTVADMLSPHVRLVRDVEVTRSADLLAELVYDAGLSRAVLIRNGLVVNAEEDFEILESDSIVVHLVPQKGVLRTIALIAVTAIASTIIGPWAAGIIGWTSRVGVAVMSAIAVAGSAALVNAVLPASAADRSTGSFGDRSNMYGWNIMTNDVSEGDAVPRLLGTLTFAPKLVDSYIETIGDKQYFNGLYLVNDGPCDAIGEPTINGVGASSFGGVTVEYRYGALDQAPMSSFSAVRDDQLVNTKVESGGEWVTMQALGSVASRLIVTLTFPGGLFSIDQTGKDAGSQRAEFWVAYVEYSMDGVHWTHFVGSPVTISDNTRSPLRRTVDSGDIPPGRYQVRVRGQRNTWPGDFTHDCEMWVDYLQESVPIGLCYPGRSLVAIRALATDKLNGSRPLVKVRATAGGSNPADQCLMILDECGVRASTIDSEAFAEWRQDCLVRSLSCDILFDTMSTLREALDLVSTLGRARVEKFGSRYSVIMDKPGQLPVQGFTFGVGNIDVGSFGIDTVPEVDRANVIDVSYYPDEKENARTVFEVSSASYNTDEKERRTALNLIGCRSLDQATRHANYLLKCNQHLTLCPYWSADLDAIVARIGDIVAVSHDIPQWGISGLVVSGTLSGVVLDREVEMDAGVMYAVQIRDADDNTIFEREVVWASGPVSEISLVTPAPVAPSLHDAFSFGPVGRVSKLVRLTGISTTGMHLRRDLVSLEYVPEVYEDGATVPADTMVPAGLSRLSVTEFIRYGVDRSIETVMWVSWSGNDLAYTVSFKGPYDQEYQSVVVLNPYLEVVVVHTGLYAIRVQDSRGHLLETTYTVRGKLAPPDPVTGLTCDVQSDTVVVSWEYSTPPIDFDHFEIQYSDRSGSWVTHGTTSLKARSYELPIMSGGENVVQVMAVDSSGVRSTPGGIRYTPSIDSVVGLTSYYADGWVWMVWDRYSSSLNGIRYEVRRGDSWDEATVCVVTADNRYIADGIGRFMVKAIYSTRYGVDIYSGEDDSLTLDNSRIPQNVVASSVDSFPWNGVEDSNVYVSTEGFLTLSAAVALDDVDDVDMLADFDSPGGLAPYGRYECADTITLASTQLCNCSIDVTSFGRNDLDDLDSADDFDAIENLDGYVAGDCEVIPMIATFNGSEWSSYRRFYPGAYAATAVRFAVDLYSHNSSIRPVISAISYMVDMPDRLDAASGLLVPETGVSVVYATPFQTVPSLQITIIDSLPGDDFIFTEPPTEYGFSGVVKNGGVAVIRTINHLSKGY